MKTLTITLGLLFALAVSTVFGAVNGKDVKVSEIRRVENFSSIDITAVATVYFKQSNRCSFKIEGKEKWVKKTKTHVKDGKLFIEREKDSGNSSFSFGSRNNEGVTIYLTAPDLTELEFSGVGSFNCSSLLKLNDVRLNVEGVGKLYLSNLICNTLRVNLQGVGKATIHVDCDYLDARVEGIGHIDLSGSTGSANISKEGIGSVDTDHLRIGQ